MTERRSTLKSHTAQTDSCFLCFSFFVNSFFLDVFMFSCAPVQFRVLKGGNIWVFSD